MEQSKVPTEGTPAHVLLTLLSMGYCVEIMPTPASERTSFTGGIRKLRALGWSVRQLYTGTHSRKLFVLAGVTLLRDSERSVPVIAVVDWAPSHIGRGRDRAGC